MGDTPDVVECELSAYARNAAAVLKLLSPHGKVEPTKLLYLSCTICYTSDSPLNVPPQKRMHLHVL